MENSEKIEKISPQTFMQRIHALNVNRYMAKRGDEFSGKEASRMEKELRQQAQLLGGKDAIEAWLKKNDPHHMRPSTFKDFDWSFLDVKSKSEN